MRGVRLGCVGVLTRLYLSVYPHYVAVYGITHMSGSSQCGEHLVETLVLAMEHSVESGLRKLCAFYAYPCAVAAFKVYGYVGKSLTIDHYGAVSPQTVGSGAVLYAHIATPLLEHGTLVGRKAILIVAIVCRAQSYCYAAFVEAYHCRMVGGIVAEVELGAKHLYVKAWRLDDERHRLVAMHLKVAFARELHMAVAYTETLRIFYTAARI